MSTSSLNLDIYFDIINEIGRFKIISTKNLYERLTSSIGYITLKRRIVNLEKLGLVKNIFIGKREKYVYLSDLGIKYTCFDSTLEPNPIELKHDLTVARVVQEFLKAPNVIDAKMYHEIDDNFINPDAVITICNGKHEFRMALEIELTQKSQSRVRDKFEKIFKSNTYDYAVYLTNKPGLLKTYLRYLSDYDIDSREQIFMSCSENLIKDGVDVDQLKFMHIGGEFDSSKIFGQI